MNLVGVERHEDLYLIRFSASKSNERFQRAHPDYNSWIAPLQGIGDSYLTVSQLGDYSSNFQVLDDSHVLSQWLLKLRETVASGQCAIDPQLAGALYIRTLSNMSEGLELMQRWLEDPEVPDTIKPPRDAKGQVARWREKVLVSRRTVTVDANGGLSPSSR